jgi:DNA-binding LacI/PurR family transcriptional regulator
MRTAEKLGYRPNLVARGLRAKKQNAIALIVPDLDNFGFTEILRGVQERLNERDTSLLVIEARTSSEELRVYENLGHTGRVDGFLVAAAHTGDVELSRWATPDLPVVFVQRDVPGASGAVVMDEELIGRTMAQFLIDLGHIAIGHVAGALDTDTALRRRQGVASALADAGLPFPRSWCSDGGFSAEGGVRATAKIFSGRGAHPTALTVANLTSALGALAALRQLGLKVPDDVSVLAVDDHFVAAHTDPPLTTVRTAQRQLGRVAADSILEAIDSGHLSRTVVDEPIVMMVRASTARPPAVKAKQPRNGT